MGYCRGSRKGKIHSHLSLTQKSRKIPNTQAKLTPKGTEKEQKIKPKPIRRREIRNNKAETNEIKIKKKTEIIPCIFSDHML